MNTILSDDRCNAIQLLAETVRDLPGAIVEVGVYRGGLVEKLARQFPDKPVFGFDTFEGLPVRDYSAGEVHKPGDFGDVSFSEISRSAAAYPNLKLVKGYFPESGNPNMLVCFAHIDVDFYLSTKRAIEFLWPRTVPGGILVFDDYDWKDCPGVKKALHECFGDTVRLTPNCLLQQQAFVIKR